MGIIVNYHSPLDSGFQKPKLHTVFSPLPVPLAEMASDAETAIFTSFRFSCIFALSSLVDGHIMQKHAQKKKTTPYRHPSHTSNQKVFSLHPGRLTWNLKMMVWKMIFLFNWVILRFHVILPGCFFLGGSKMANLRLVWGSDVQGLKVTPNKLVIWADRFRNSNGQIPAGKVSRWCMAHVMFSWPTWPGTNRYNTWPHDIMAL